MRAIGFRAEKDAIHWAVVEPVNDSTLKLTHYGEINAGESEDAPKALRTFRDQVRLLIEQHSPTSAVVRSPESYGRKAKNILSVDSRLRVEGVIIEAVGSKGVPVRCAALKSISSLLESDAAKEYLDGEQLRGIKFPKKDKNCREAILAAAAGLGVKK